MNILAVAAHPDDAELGCFGTLLELLGQGQNVYAVALAPGKYGKHSRAEVERAWNRARDLLRKARRSGAEAEYILADFPIGRLEHNWDTVDFVDSLVSKYHIDSMVTHHYGEAHQDHIVAQKIPRSRLTCATVCPVRSRRQEPPQPSRSSHGETRNISRTLTTGMQTLGF